MDFSAFRLVCKFGRWSVYDNKFGSYYLYCDNKYHDVFYDENDAYIHAFEFSLCDLGVSQTHHGF